MSANRLERLIREALAKSKGQPTRKAKNAKGTPRQASALELELRGQVLMAGLTEGIQVEYRALPDRNFRWDLAWPNEPHRLLVEIQGGIWAEGGHTTGVGVTRDCEKATLAALAGFRCLAVTSDHISSGQALRWIQEALREDAA